MSENNVNQTGKKKFEKIEFITRRVKTVDLPKIEHKRSQESKYRKWVNDFVATGAMDETEVMTAKDNKDLKSADSQVRQIVRSFNENPNRQCDLKIETKTENEAITEIRLSKGNVGSIKLRQRKKPVKAIT